MFNLEKSIKDYEDLKDKVAEYFGIPIVVSQVVNRLNNYWFIKDDDVIFHENITSLTLGGSRFSSGVKTGEKFKNGGYTAMLLYNNIHIFEDYLEIKEDNPIPKKR
jgi:hypothetical protein